jgi:hypothetical protein
MIKTTHLLGSIALTASLLVANASAAVFFETFDYYGAPPVIGTDAANLNGSKFQVGSWSGTLPAGHGSAPGSPEVVRLQQGSIEIDRPVADAFIRGDFSRPMVKDGTQLNFDYATARAGNTNGKDVDIVGLDASGNEAFHFVMGADNNGGGPTAIRRMGFYTDNNATFSLAFPDATPANGDLSPATGNSYNPDFARIGLIFTPAGYSVSFARANAWSSSIIPYNNAAVGDITAIEFRFQGDPSDTNEQSGFFIDNFYAGAKQVPEPSTATLLLVGVLGLRYGRKLFRPKTTSG